MGVLIYSYRYTDMKTLILLFTFISICVCIPQPEGGPEPEPEFIEHDYCPGATWATSLINLGNGPDVTWIMVFQMFKKCRLECSIDLFLWTHAHFDIGHAVLREANNSNDLTDHDCNCIACLKTIPQKPTWEQPHALDQMRNIPWIPCSTDRC